MDLPQKKHVPSWTIAQSPVDRYKLSMPQMSKLRSQTFVIASALAGVLVVVGGFVARRLNLFDDPLIQAAWAAAGSPLLVPLWNIIRKRWHRDAVITDEIRRQATTSLAERVDKRCEAAEFTRRLGDSTVAVQWVERTHTLGEPWADDNPALEAREGNVDTLSALVPIRGGRPLVIIGAEDSGKSAAVIKMARALIRTRTSAGGPVPIIVSPHGWDLSTQQPLSGWLADRLYREYPFLADRAYPPGLVEEIINHGDLVFFIDGFEEAMAAAYISDESRSIVQAWRAAWEKIRRAQVPLVIVGRSEEFREFASRNGLSSHDMTVAEITGVTADDARRYLGEVAGQYTARRKEVVAALGRTEGALSQATRSPLYLSLLKESLTREGDVKPLCDFTLEVQDVQNRLIDQLILRSYPDGEDRRARRYLGFFAAQMDDRDLPSLSWWEPARWTPSWARIATNGLIGAFSGTAVIAVTGFAGALLDYRYPVNGIEGVVLGLFAGLAVGLATERNLAKPDRSVMPRGSDGFNLGIGLACGIMVAWTLGRMITVRHGLVAALPVALVAAVISCVVAGFASGGAAPKPGKNLPPPHQALTWLAINVNLAIGTAVALPIALVLAFLVGPLVSVPTGVVIGLLFGLVDRRGCPFTGWWRECIWLRCGGRCG
jgi:hypothetical protein